MFVHECVELAADQYPCTLQTHVLQSIHSVAFLRGIFGRGNPEQGWQGSHAAALCGIPSTGGLDVFIADTSTRVFVRRGRWIEGCELRIFCSSLLFSVSFLFLFTSETETAVPAWACNLATQMVCVLNKSDCVPPLSSSGVCQFTSPPCYHIHETTHTNNLLQSWRWFNSSAPLYRSPLLTSTLLCLFYCTAWLYCSQTHQQRTVLLSNKLKTAEVLIASLRERERPPSSGVVSRPFSGSDVSELFVVCRVSGECGLRMLQPGATCLVPLTVVPLPSSSHCHVHLHQTRLNIQRTFITLHSSWNFFVDQHRYTLRNALHYPEVQNSDFSRFKQ